MMIRKMRLSDVAQVAGIERQCFSVPWSEKSFAEAAEDANALFLVAAEALGEEQEEIVAGYIGMYLSAPEGEITNVAVAEPFRGKGCGNALIQAMMRNAPEIDRIFLEVRCSNAAAIHLYEKTGFAEIGVRKGFYDFPKEDAKVMQWKRI